MSRKKQSFLQGAMILSGAAILTKVIGALFFKIPLQNLNNTAYGYFAAAFNIYIPIYTISTAGFPIAVSRMVSESITLGRLRDVRVIHRVAVRVFLITGLIGTGVMLICAFIYPQFVRIPNTRLPMLVMAPAILFCCLISAYRGVYEGSRNMVPTAVSQILEAVGKLALGLGLAAGAMKLGEWQFQNGQAVFGRVVKTAEEAVDASLPYVAAGAMVGVTAGSFLALFYVMMKYHREGNGITRAELLAAPRPRTSKAIFRALLAFAVPVAMGTLATQLTNLIDVVSLQKCLAVVLEKHPDVVQGMYASQIAQNGTNDLLAFLTGNRDIAITYVNLIPNVTLTFGISALPVITSAWALRDREQLKKMVALVLRITLLVALPSGIGLSVLAKPVLRMINGPVVADIAGPMLQIMGLAVVFICLVAPINAMLQAMGRADIPAKIVLVGGIIKLTLNLVLVLNPNLNILGSAYSTFFCYLVMVALSLIALRRVARVKLQWRFICMKPLIAALCCGTAAWSANGLLAHLMPQKAATLLAVLLAGAVYLLVLLLTRAITRDEIIMLPKGQKIAQTLEKCGWIG